MLLARVVRRAVLPTVMRACNGVSLDADLQHVEWFERDASVAAVTLGIETSGRSGRIALRVDGTNLEERELSQSGRRHAQTLVLEIRELVTIRGLSPRDIELVAVSEGPGSFTGLRVGVVCAKTLAWASAARMVLVDTMLAIASESPADVCRVDVVSDAQRGQLFVASCERLETEGGESGDAWHRPASVQVMQVNDWVSGISGKTDDGFVVTGPGLSRAVDFLPDKIRQLERSRAEPAAVTIAQLGEGLAAQGCLADPMTVEPFYLRKSAAEDKRDLLRQSTTKQVETP